MSDVTIVLTFDDGPSPSQTGHVLKLLDHPPGGLGPIKAAFFVQTHAPVCMGTHLGQGLVRAAYQAGHMIGIHTGSDDDHACHKERVLAPPYALPPGLPEGRNGLDCDMIRAKDAIKKVTGAIPKYVRATWGYMNDLCGAVYGRQLLKHVYWDVDSGDALKGSDAKKVDENLRKQIIAAIGQSRRELIVLFRDRNPVTSDKNNLAEFITTISSTSTSKNKVLFAGSRSEMENIFDRLTRNGPNRPCPAARSKPGDWLMPSQVEGVA